MPLTNWPPPTAPSWPPAELGFSQVSYADIRNLLAELIDWHFTQSAPTAAEVTALFKNARCDEGHAVIGRILISPLGIRYPFAVCNNGGHRQLLVLWGPDYCMGGLSGVE